MNPQTPVSPHSFFTRKTAGRWLGPLAAGLTWYLLAGLPEAAQRTAAVGVLMAVFWVCESVPVAVTSLIPVALFPMLGIADSAAATGPFARPVIFLFLGGFMMATAVEKCGLHRRIALLILSRVGDSPAAMLAGFMAATAFLSMWISNTATTVMMVPIALSLASRVGTSQLEDQTDNDRFDTCLLLGIAWSASIGGLGTPIGTPPNALLMGVLRQHGIEIGFGQWMLAAIPLVVVFLLAAWGLLSRRFLHISRVSVDARMIVREYRSLGRMNRDERLVMMVFILTVSSWILHEPLAGIPAIVRVLPWFSSVNDSGIAVIGAICLFLIPGQGTREDRLLDWQTAAKLPWGVLILFGGGLSLASAMNSSGLTDALATKLTGLGPLPLPLLILIVTGIIIFLTEVASNTATAAAFLPVLFHLGMQTCGTPLPLMVPATIAASCAFMLPVATAPNAVVHGTGRVSSAQMMRLGLWLNLLGLVLIPLFMMFWGTPVLNP